MKHHRSVQHHSTVQQEFARQAEAFAASPTLAAPDVTERVAAALGEGRLGRVLDVACGPGVLTPVLAPRTERLVSVDLTPEVLQLARQRAQEGRISNATFARGMIELLPFAPKSFDAAVLRLALHHFDAPEACLRAIRGVLGPTGQLVLLDILGSTDPGTALLHEAIERLRDPSHHRLYALPRLREVVSDAGFEIERCETWSKPREVRDWAGIVADAKRTEALEVVLRQLCRSGVSAGLELREIDGSLWMTYSWCLLVARAAGA